MYKIDQYEQIKNFKNADLHKKQQLQNYKKIVIQKQIDKQLKNHYDNTYCINDNNNLQYLQTNTLINDISKMRILPPHCPMEPHSYSDFFNDNKSLHKIEPYKIKVETHPKDGKLYTKIEYNNFYRDFKKDALKYNSPPMQTYDDDDDTMPNNTMPNINKLYNQLQNENVKLFTETKNQKGFAIPMKSNGSNKLEHIYNDCLNKPTFEYKKFGYDNTIKHNSNADNWVDNPLFNINISEETDNLYNQYMSSRVQNVDNIYNSVFEDMYILGYNPSDI